MNSRAWALAAMTCALLVAPNTLADEAAEPSDDEVKGLVPSLSPGYLFDPDDLEDGCTSMLRATFVSFGGNVFETDLGEETFVAYVDGEHHTTTHYITEFLRLVLNPFGDEVTELLDVAESTETITESTVVEGILHHEWERDLLVWERIERTVAVPLPAEGEVSYAESDVVSSCDADENLSIEFPVYGGSYDRHWGHWYYEPYAPETPEPEWIYTHIDHTFTPGAVDAETEYDDYRHGHCACPVRVAQATEEYVRGLHPVTEETIEIVESIFVEDDEGEEESEEEAAQEDATGETSDDAASFGLQSIEALPLGAKVGAGSGLGLAGLLGTILAVRRH